MPDIPPRMTTAAINADLLGGRYKNDRDLNKTLRRLGLTPVDTTRRGNLWDGDQVRRALAARPGRGTRTDLTGPASTSRKNADTLDTDDAMILRFLATHPDAVIRSSYRLDLHAPAACAPGRRLERLERLGLVRRHVRATGATIARLTRTGWLRAGQLIPEDDPA